MVQEAEKYKSEDETHRKRVEVRALALPAWLPISSAGG